MDREIRMILSDEEIAQIKDLMVKLNQPLWKSFIPPGLNTLVKKVEKAIHGNS